MKNSSEFLDEKIKKESIASFEVPSNSEEGKKYLVHLKPDGWYCSCRSFEIRRTCSHIRKVLEPVGEGEKCFWCGKTAWVAKGLDKHHVERRSISVDRVKDASNIMFLCRTCHDRATNEVEFENNLIKIWNLIWKKN